jgi:hypothetical protein
MPVSGPKTIIIYRQNFDASAIVGNIVKCRDFLKKSGCRRQSSYVSLSFAGPLVTSTATKIGHDRTFHLGSTCSGVMRVGWRVDVYSSRRSRIGRIMRRRDGTVARRTVGHIIFCICFTP